MRAFNPSPGAVARLRDEDIKVWSAAPLPASGAPPGTILRVETSGIDVACGAGALRLRELQRPGGRRLAVAAFLRGRALAPGDAFAVAAPIASSHALPAEAVHPGRAWFCTRGKRLFGDSLAVAGFAPTGTMPNARGNRLPSAERGARASAVCGCARRAP